MQQLQIKNIYICEKLDRPTFRHIKAVLIPPDGSLPISNTNNWSTYIFDSASVSIHPMVWTCIKIHRNSLEIYDQNDAIIFRCASDMSVFATLGQPSPSPLPATNHIATDATASHPRFICFQAFPLSEQILICMTMSDGRTDGWICCKSKWLKLHSLYARLAIKYS